MTILTIVFGIIMSLLALSTIISVIYRNGNLGHINLRTLMVLLIVQLGIAVAGFVTKTQILTLLGQTMVSAESEYLEDSSVNITWNALQQDFQCCGVYDYKEWFKYLDNSSLPDSCCVDYAAGCGGRVNITGGIYHIGCSAAISNWCNTLETVTAAVFAILVVIQVLSVVFSTYHVEGEGSVPYMAPISF